MMKNVIKQKYISLNTNLFWLNKNTFWYHEKNWLSATFQQQYWINHSHKKRKDSLETRTVLLIFLLELEISGVAVQSIQQNSEKWWLLLGTARWKWLWGRFNHFLLLWPWCQGFWGSSEDRYRSKRVLQMPLCVIICWIAKIYLSINNSEKCLVTGIPLT